MSYLCLRISEFPTQTLLSLRPEMHHQSVAVLDHEPPLQRVCSMNGQASVHGVRHGMTRVEMENIPGIVAMRRSLNEEQSLKATVVLLLGQYTPRLQEVNTDCVCCLVLDLAGTGLLIGPPAQVATRIQKELKALGLESAICVCSHVPTALAIMRTLRHGSAPVLISSGQERASLAPLPLNVIEPDAALAERFERWGIHTLGQLAALPLSDLIARVGQSAKRLHQLATGTQPHLFRPTEQIFALQAQVVFEDSIELMDSLLFALGPMLERLIALVTAKALALLSLQLTLKLEGNGEHSISVKPALSSVDRKFLLKLFQLELAAHPPSAAVVALKLIAEPAPPSREQGGLFSPQLPDASRLDVTLARIQSVVGEGNVGSAQLRDSHAPEGFAMLPFQLQLAASIREKQEPPVRMAFRRFCPPWNAYVTQDASRPSFIACEHQQFRVKHAYGPWYSSGEWWNSSAWAREEWEVILRAENAPIPLHALLVHDLITQDWRLEGIYD